MIHPLGYRPHASNQDHMIDRYKWRENTKTISKLVIKCYSRVSKNLTRTKHLRIIDITWNYTQSMYRWRDQKVCTNTTLNKQFVKLVLISDVLLPRISSSFFINCRLKSKIGQISKYSFVYKLENREFKCHSCHHNSPFHKKNKYVIDLYKNFDKIIF